MVIRELDLEGKLAGTGAAINVMGGECAAQLAIDNIGIMGISGMSIDEAEIEREKARLILLKNGSRKGKGYFFENVMGVADNFEDHIKEIEASDISDGVVCAALPHPALLKKLNPRNRTFDKIALLKLGKLSVDKPKRTTIDFVHTYFDGAILEGSDCGGHIMKDLNDFRSTQALYKTFREVEKQKGYESLPLILCNVNDTNIEDIIKLRKRFKDDKIALAKGNLFYVSKEAMPSNAWKKRQIFNDHFVSEKRIKDCEKYGMKIHEPILVISPVGHYYGRIAYNEFVDMFFNYDPNLQAYKVDQDKYYDLIGGVGISCDTINCMAKVCKRDICINYALKNASSGNEYPLKDSLEKLYIWDFKSMDSLNILNYIKDMMHVTMNEEIDHKRLEEITAKEIIDYTKGKPFKRFYDGF